MKLDIPNAKYVLAVSGGVDSMVLLDILSGMAGLELVLAHFNHEIRHNSEDDELFVVETAKRLYGLNVIVGWAKLGSNGSEELARQGRYEFLNSVVSTHKAAKIITAHHQDDLIETAFINLVRGSGARGLFAIADNPKVLRPLLNIPKTSLLDYAGAHNLQWREDSTNSDTKYLRNYIRLNILPAMTDHQRQEFIASIENVSKNDAEKKQLLMALMRKTVSGRAINRNLFNNLPTEIAAELLVYWMRQEKIEEFDKLTIERILVAIKTAKTGTKHPIKSGVWLSIETGVAKLTEENKCLV
jgi:tRNA(Ile)-lysidine synthase